jgi:hypothetical protein
MEWTSGRGGLNDFLCGEPEEKGHADFVDGETRRLHE